MSVDLGELFASVEEEFDVPLDADATAFMSPRELVEQWGGDVVSVEVSAVKKQGIDDLLDMIVLTADMLDLKANPDQAARGVVLEAKKEVGRGIVATVLVQDGTLKIGDSFFSGSTYGKVRAMTDQGVPLSS